MKFNSTMPIYLQIVEEIKKQIVYGDRKPGSKVESVRDFAKIIGVNPNTMQRAFAELEREKLIYTERTSGRFITTDSALIEEVKLELVKKKIIEFGETMKNSGYSKSEILKYIEEFME